MSYFLDGLQFFKRSSESFSGGHGVTRSDNRDCGNAQSWGITSAVAACGVSVAFFMRFVWSLTGGSTCVAMRT